MRFGFIFVTALACTSLAEEVLVPGGGGTAWRYLDSAAAPAGTWTQPDFDDKAWKEGAAPVGYGERGLGTTISFGADEDNKPLAAWFRHAFEVADLARVETLGIFLRCDDGAAVYLNGREVARHNLPPGALDARTAAVDAVDREDEATVHRFIVPAKGALRAGRNVVAVSVHQAYPASSDLFLDLSVKAWAPGETPPRERTAAERALEAAQRAYDAEPGEMETAYAWVRAHVVARTGLAVKVTPRPLPAEVPAEWRFINDGPKWPDSSRKLPRAAALADLDYLEEMIANCYSYAGRRGVDWRAALDALRAGITGDIPLGTFLWRLERFMTVFGDPHSSFGGNPAAPSGRLPVIFVPDGERLLAVKVDRSGFLNADTPYVTGIGGIPVAQWLAAANDSVPKASPQYQRLLAASALSRAEELAWQLGLRPGAELELALASADGAKTATVKAPVGRSARPRVWPAGETRRMGGIGYLRIAQMDGSEAFVARLNREMWEFRDTDGLVIDVRGNGGGTQDALKTLLPYFMAPEEPLRIVNIAAYRLPLPLPRPNPEGFLGLGGRGLHPASSRVWDASQRAEIAAFMKTWKPQWELPRGEFSDWHFMGVSRATNPAAYHYEKPVVVLQDAGCFSATDNFLGALKGVRNVTLLGTTSGGGSGRMARYALPNAKFDFTLCQMASFSRTGATYDGNGVAPDVTVEAAPEDALVTGKDRQLQAALARLGVK